VATKPAVTYGGPKSFVARNIADVTALLDRAFQAVDTAIRKLSDGGPRRWVFAPVLRGNGTIAPNVVIPVDTVASPTIVLTLMPHDPRDIGLECGIQRLYASGIVVLFPVDGATLDGSTASQVLPTLAGMHYVTITPTGYTL
jgi:hypothetical protein